jgi:hypothetical protein
LRIARPVPRLATPVRDLTVRLATPGRAVRSAPRGLPLAGALLAVVLLISRRPDAVTHAQFFGEDGMIYFQNVYGHGVLRTLLVPQAGYLQSFSVLAAGVAQLVPLAQAPLVTDLLAIAAQALVVALLLSDRTAAFIPDVRVRALLAALYIAAPDEFELHATAVNAQWHLALAALLVLLTPVPASRAGRALDVGALLLSGLTGPFCILLAPLALIQRGWRGAGFAPWWRIAVPASCAVVQLICLVAVSRHAPEGFNVIHRPMPELGATPSLFVQLIGSKLLATPLIGEPAALSLSSKTDAVLTLLALVAALRLARTAPPELRLTILFAGALLVVALARPLTPSPAWTVLTEPINGNRYFAIPRLAFLACLVWLACRHGRAIVRGGAVTLLLIVAVVAVPGGWVYGAFADTGYAARAATFERAPKGTTVRFPVNPSPENGRWTMVLRKR